MQRQSTFTYKSPKTSPIMWNYRTSSLYRTSTPISSAESLRNNLSTIKCVSDETLVEMYPYDKDVAEAYGWDKSESTISAVTLPYMMNCSTDGSVSAVDSGFLCPPISKSSEKSTYSTKNQPKSQTSRTFSNNALELSTPKSLPPVTGNGVSAMESMKKLYDLIEQRKERRELYKKVLANKPSIPSESYRDYSKLRKSDVGYGEMADYNCGHWDLRQFER